MSKILKIFVVFAASLGIIALGATQIPWTGASAAQPEPTSAPPSGDVQPVVMQPTSAPPPSDVQPASVQPMAAAPTATVPAPTPVVPALVQQVDEFRGTVRPPGCKGVTILSNGPLSGGEYSICGQAVAKVILKQEGLEVELRLQNHTTKGAGKVLVGTIELTVRLDKKKVDGPHDPYADIQLCYAVPPGKEVEVKFYDTEQNTWVALETTVENGQACAVANYSGDYVLVEK